MIWLLHLTWSLNLIGFVDKDSSKSALFGLDHQQVDLVCRHLHLVLLLVKWDNKNYQDTISSGSETVQHCWNLFFSWSYAAARRECSQSSTYLRLDRNAIPQSRLQELDTNEFQHVLKDTVSFSSSPYCFEAQ